MQWIVQDRAFQSWGKIPKVSQKVCVLNWGDEAKQALIDAKDAGQSVLPYGNGRSYGDCCLNESNGVIATSQLNRFLSFEPSSCTLRCESGVTLSEILRVFVPKGYFLSTTPGTQFVTVGGAIANDVHGKNHHRAGTFGRYVKSFGLLRSDGVYVCSRETNPELFSATIGGLGLTGLVLWAEIVLRPIETPYISAETVKFSTLEEFFALSEASDKDYEYTVAWLDCVSKGAQFGRGLFMSGNHATYAQVKERAPALAKSKYAGEPPRAIFTAPMDAPAWVLGPWSVSLFNWAYYNKQQAKKVQAIQPYAPFFYPLDSVNNWNRIYGKRGFYQFQCVIPKTDKKTVLSAILGRIVQDGGASFLAVLKEFGNVESPAVMSFPRPGVTLCLDVANLGAGTIKTMKELETMVREASGAMYAAKDALMSPESFKAFFPRWKEVEERRDPSFSSSLWRRVTA